jgi:beta-lactamase superfamily II metal-dependent hydrolase
MTKFHFVNVGQGNMVVGIFPNGQVLVYDCNITNENETAVFSYLQRVMPKAGIDVFVNSHRDADHMRGVKKLHEKYPISSIWDSGVSGNIDTDEYREYMDLRRRLIVHEVGAGQYWIDNPGVRILNGKREGLNDPNSQSIVLHIDYSGSSLLLAGDTSIRTWRDYIIPEFGAGIKSLVLYASHHGSLSFFNEIDDHANDFTGHVSLINPAITIISVGAGNQFSHPHVRSLGHYENHSYGAQNGQKIFRTDLHGNMQLELYGSTNPASHGHISWMHE